MRACVRCVRAFLKKGGGVGWVAETTYVGSASKRVAPLARLFIGIEVLSTWGGQIVRRGQMLAVVRRTWHVGDRIQVSFGVRIL